VIADRVANKLTEASKPATPEMVSKWLPGPEKPARPRRTTPKYTTERVPSSDGCVASSHGPVETSTCLGEHAGRAAAALGRRRFDYSGSTKESPSRVTAVCATNLPFIEAPVRRVTDAEKGAAGRSTMETQLLVAARHKLRTRAAAVRTSTPTSRFSPFSHSARNRIIKTEVEGNERFDADRCILFQRKVGDHFAEDTIVVDSVLHRQALAKNGGAMSGGRLRDRMVRDPPASPYKEQSVPDLVQEQREPVR
jgi:hypothetical protein